MGFNDIRGPLSPALRRRLSEVDEAARLTLRELVGEFGSHVAPEVAYRMWKDSAQSIESGMLGVINLSHDQQVQVGRMQVIARTLSRIGARFEGSRSLSPDRKYYLPANLRDVRSVGGSLLGSINPQAAIKHLRSRWPVLEEGKSRSWTIDDRVSVMALINLAERVEAAGMTADLLADQVVEHPELINPEVSEPTPAPKVEIPAGPPEGVINPRIENSPSWIGRMRGPGR